MEPKLAVEGRTGCTDRQSTPSSVKAPRVTDRAGVDLGIDAGVDRRQRKSRVDARIDGRQRNTSIAGVLPRIDGQRNAPIHTSVGPARIKGRISGGASVCPGIDGCVHTRVRNPSVQRAAFFVCTRTKQDKKKRGTPHSTFSEVAHLHRSVVLRQTGSEASSERWDLGLSAVPVQSGMAFPKPVREGRSPTSSTDQAPLANWVLRRCVSKRSRDDYETLSVRSRYTKTRNPPVKCRNQAQSERFSTVRGWRS